MKYLETDAELFLKKGENLELYQLLLLMNLIRNEDKGNESRFHLRKLLVYKHIVFLLDE